jgi:outer membrane protein
MPISRQRYSTVARTGEVTALNLRVALRGKIVRPATAALLTAACGSALGSSILSAQGRDTIPPPPAQGPSIDTILAASDTLEIHTDTSLKLNDIIQRAIQTSPVTASAQANVDIARSSRRVAYGEWLPTLLGQSYLFRNGLPSSEAISSTSPATAVSPNASVLNPSGGGGFVSPPPSTGTLTTSGTSTTAGVLTGPGLHNPFSRVLQTADTGVGGVGGAATGAGGGPYFDAYAEAIASWDIFTWGRRPADAKYAHELVRSALSARRDQEYQVQVQVKTTFYNLLRDEDLEVVGRAEVVRAEQDARAAVHRREVGTATPADVLQFEYNLAAAREALIQAQINHRSDAYALGRLAGFELAIGATRESDYEPTPLPMPDTAIIALALSEAPILLASRDSARAARAAVYSATTQYGPTISVAGSYSWYSQPATLGSTRPGWGLDVGTSYPVFNGFVREDAIERAHASSYVAEVTARDAERYTRAQAQALLGAVGLAVEEVKIAKGNLVVSREYYRVTLSRYNVGAATVIDLSVAEQNLATAEQQDVNARYNYQLARANLETLLGRSLGS